jgi:hypothetical protein
LLEEEIKGVILYGIDARMNPFRTNLKSGGLMQPSIRTNRPFLGLVALGLFLTAGQAISANTAYYDTAWTYVYDGGKAKNGRVIGDNFSDLKILPNGDAICVGDTRDTAWIQSVLIIQLSTSGNAKKN